jgi:hypothetical protein
MDEWFTLQTLVAFILGVLLSAMVKALVASVRGKAAGAMGSGG